MTFSRDHHPFFLPPNSSGRSNKAKQNRVSQNSAPPSCSNHFYHLLHLYLISSIFSLAETIEPSQTSKNHSPQARPSDIALVAGYLPTYLLRYYTNRHRRRIVSSPSVSDHDPLTLSPLSQCSKGHPVPPLLQTIRNDPRPPRFVTTTQGTPDCKEILPLLYVKILRTCQSNWNADPLVSESRCATGKRTLGAAELVRRPAAEASD